MKFLRTILILTALPGMAFAAKIDYPEWSDTAEVDSYRLGGALWPTGILPNAPPEPVAETEEAAKPKGAPDDAKFYGPQPESAEGMEVGNTVEEGAPTEELPPEPVPEPEPLPPLEGDLADLYFEHPPIEFLIDPQRLLTEQKSNDIKRFLEFHSDEAEFKIFVMVLGETQKIPNDINLRQLHQDWFSDDPTVLMVYYREVPELTELVLNDAVRTSLPKSVFDRILQNVLREGAATDDAPDQVEKMAIELSIQLYWLGRLMESETKEEREIAANTALEDMPASADAPDLLREYAPGLFISERPSVKSFITMGIGALGMLFILGIGGWIYYWWRDRNSLTGRPLIFPNFEVVPRLGGEFSGGTYIGMSFEINESGS